MGDHLFRGQQLLETGIGYAGIEGAWWLPALTSFSLPSLMAADLERIAAAQFLFLDSVEAIYRKRADQELGRLLHHRVPRRYLRCVGNGRVDLLRPDFQLVPKHDGPSEDHPVYELVATELEVCPSAQGTAHAMQVVYGLEPDLVESFARYLDGRDFLMVGCTAWSAFIFEQLAFCEALEKKGVRARVLYDRPIGELAALAGSQKLWQPPLFGVPEQPPRWDVDLVDRVRRRGYESCLWSPDDRWPDCVEDAVVFRFGYVDSFAQEHLEAFGRWRKAGATLINPPSFIADSKVLLATLSLPSLRLAIDEQDGDALSILDRTLPETRLLTSALVPQLLDGREEWVVKIAGFDGGDLAWGGHSLRVGAACTMQEWERHIHHLLTLPCPVVAQRTVPTASPEIGYADGEGNARRLLGGRIRLRSFFLRQEDSARAAGTHVTVTDDGFRVAEGVTAVQAPVRFSD